MSPVSRHEFCGSEYPNAVPLNQPEKMLVAGYDQIGSSGSCGFQDDVIAGIGVHGRNAASGVNEVKSVSEQRNHSGDLFCAQAELRPEQDILRLAQKIG